MGSILCAKPYKPPLPAPCKCSRPDLPKPLSAQRQPTVFSFSRTTQSQFTAHCFLLLSTSFPNYTLYCQSGSSAYGFLLNCKLLLQNKRQVLVISFLPNPGHRCGKLLGKEAAQALHIRHEHVARNTARVQVPLRWNAAAMLSQLIVYYLPPPPTSPTSRLTFQKHKVSLRCLQVFHLSRRPGIKILGLPRGL